MFKTNRRITDTTCYNLQNHQVIKLPKNFHHLEVLSGTAWVTIAKQDLIVRSGQTVSLPISKDFAVISSLTKSPLVLAATT